MGPPIEKLFNKNRLDGSVLQLLLLTVYIPVGLMLMLLRLFISLQLILAVTVLPRGATITRLMLRCLCGVLGLIVRQENMEHNPLYADEEEEEQLQPDKEGDVGSGACSGGSGDGGVSSSSGGGGTGEGGEAVAVNRGRRSRVVVVANHVTPFDHFALSLVMPCAKISCNGEGIPWPLSYLLGIHVINLQPSASPPSPPPPPSGLQHVPPPPRRDEAFITKLKSFVMLSGGGGISGSGGGGGNTSGGAAHTGGVEGARSSGGGVAPSKDNLPLLLFPEDATTNGTVALLKYAPWAVAACPEGAGGGVSVASVRVCRVPALPLATSVLSSSFTQELATLFFCPLTVYTVRYLGRVRRLPGEQCAEYSSRLQHTTAESLNLHASLHDRSDKAEYLKRCVAAQQNASWSSPAPHDGGGGWGVAAGADVTTLARQVQEVLPHLPLAAVLRDVARTRNVDITITNFLEGAVPDYTPLLPPQSPSLSLSALSSQSTFTGLSSSPTTSASFASSMSSSTTPTSSVGYPLNSSTPTTSSLIQQAERSGMTADTSTLGINSPTGEATSPSPLPPINLNTKASCFDKCANNRMLSFQERKVLLLENARRKYIQSFGFHGEKDPYLNI